MRRPLLDNAGPFARHAPACFQPVIGLIPRTLLLGVAALAAAMLLYVCFLAAVVGLVPVSQLAGVSPESAGRLAGIPPAASPSFADVLVASTVVQNATGGHDIGVSAVAFNHFVAASGRAAPQLEWARARIDGSGISVEGELRGHLNVPFAGRATAAVAGGTLSLQLSVERFGILPLPGFLNSVRQWKVEVPASPYLTNLFSLPAASVG